MAKIIEPFSVVEKPVDKAIRFEFRAFFTGGSLMPRGILAICLATLLLLTGCGYRLSGGGPFPFNIKRLAVDVFENRTRETGLETTVTNDLVYEITRSRQVELVRKDGADAVMVGVLKSLSDDTISRSGTITANERRVVLTVDVRLEGPDGQALRRVDGLVENEAYAVGSSSAGTEANRKAALAVLSRRLAEKIYARMTEDF
jgi:outer membrane lipopolysaccharide assembly protein LptE/RlpB